MTKRKRPDKALARLQGGPLDGQTIRATDVCELGFPRNHLNIKCKETSLAGEGQIPDAEVFVEQREVILYYHYQEYRNAHVYQGKEILE